MTGRERRWTPDGPLDVLATLAPLRRGYGDPAHRVDAAGVFWRAAMSPDGPVTLALRLRSGVVHATAWGPGADWALEGVPDLLGRRDDPTGFVPRHPVLRDAARRHPGLRIPRTGLVFDQLVPAVLEQKVTGKEARRSWRELLLRYGAPAPGRGVGPATLRVPPDARTLLALPDWDWHRAGVDRTRRRTIRAVATVADRLEDALDLDAVAAQDRLRRVPGVGAWTAAEVAQRSWGDADAVSVGDYNIPNLVGWALTGARTDDAGMLALLAPYQPHRHRVVRLIEVSGVAPPRRGPRLAVRDYRAM
jgi:3-methyladenine DNA glycosylase/8-oxoguanine DNA glycosylase